MNILASHSPTFTFLASVHFVLDFTENFLRREYNAWCLCTDPGEDCQWQQSRLRNIHWSQDQLLHAMVEIWEWEERRNHGERWRPPENYTKPFLREKSSQIESSYSNWCWDMFLIQCFLIIYESRFSKQMLSGLIYEYYMCYSVIPNMNHYSWEAELYLLSYLET